MSAIWQRLKTPSVESEKKLCYYILYNKCRIGEKMRENRYKSQWIIPLEILIISILIGLLSVHIQPEPFGKSMGYIMSSPALILLNIFPIIVLVSALLFATGNVFISGGINAFLFGMLSYVNTLKIEGRDDPLVPADFVLLREAVHAAGDYHINMHYEYLILILLVVSVMIILGYTERKNDLQLKAAVWKRVCGTAISVAFLVIAVLTVYPSSGLYSSFKVKNEYNMTTVMNKIGVNYFFLRNLNLYALDVPDGYNKNEVLEWIQEYKDAGGKGEDTQAEGKAKPNIVFVMCEAFSDLPNMSVFEYSEIDNPIYEYNELIKSSDCISGYIVTPNFGAGTANTEFDVMTGMQTNLLSSSSDSALRTFHKEIVTLPRVYKNEGYKTLYMHPGEDWFYNRNSALSYMGIDEKIFDDDFTAQGDLNDDETFFQELKIDIESLESGDPMFIFATTIQNHQAYVYSKYDETVADVKTDVKLSKEAMERISVYMHGLESSSKLLGNITEYLDNKEEPFILCFFGDHLPNLGTGYLAYEELGLEIGKGNSAESIIATYKTPFVIWFNQAYKDAYGTETGSNNLGFTNERAISANFLGSVVYEVTGMKGSNEYYDFLCDLRRQLPVIKKGIYGLPDGTYTQTGTAEQNELKNKLWCWQYYKLKTEIVEN